MTAKKGEVRNPNGRPKGQNKATYEFKEAVTDLLRMGSPQLISWLERVALDDPSKALDHVHKFAQFSFPLLARTTHAGDAKEPVHTTLNISDDMKKELIDAIKSQF